MINKCCLWILIIEKVHILIFDCKWYYDWLITYIHSYHKLAHSSKFGLRFDSRGYKMESTHKRFQANLESLYYVLNLTNRNVYVLLKIDAYI